MKNNVDKIISHAESKETLRNFDYKKFNVFDFEKTYNCIS